MVKYLLGFGLVLSIGFGLGASLPDEGCGQYVIGPQTATGYGATEKDAIQHAYEVLADAIELITDGLPPGHVVSGVWTTNGAYNGISFDIEYLVMVDVPCPE